MLFTSLMKVLSKYICRDKTPIGRKTMSDYRRTTRSDKHGKRQKQNKLILIFGSLAILFLIIFSSLIIFGSKGNPTEDTVTSSEEEAEQEQEEKEDQDEENDDKAIEEEDKSEEDKDHKPKDKMLELEKEKEEEEKEVTTKEVSSDDPNVKKAYTGDWKPIGTEQTGEHTTSYDAGSSDRIEIKQAVAQAIKMDEDEMIEYWIGRGGDQQVIATVSDTNMDNIHRVYLDWVDEKGWLVTKVEELNDIP